MKRNEREGPPLAEILERGERECNFLFCGQELKSENIWAPQAWVKFVQNFKYVGILIPRYTIINYHFLTWGKNNIPKIIGSTKIHELSEYP